MDHRMLLCSDGENLFFVLYLIVLNYLSTCPRGALPRCEDLRLLDK